MSFHVEGGFHSYALQTVLRFTRCHAVGTTSQAADSVESAAKEDDTSTLDDSVCTIRSQVLHLHAFLCCALLFICAYLRVCCIMSMYFYGTGCKTDGGEITGAKQRKRISCRWRSCIRREAEVWAEKKLYVLYVALTFCSTHCLKKDLIVQSIVFPAPK